jgi:hypothetical protein
LVLVVWFSVKPKFGAHAKHYAELDTNVQFAQFGTKVVQFRHILEVVLRN